MNFKRKKEKKTEQYVIEKCINCGMEKKRKFKHDDFLFQQIGSCGSCNDGHIQIEMIFGEVTVEK